MRNESTRDSSGGEAEILPDRWSPPGSEDGTPVPQGRHQSSWRLRTQVDDQPSALEEHADDNGQTLEVRIGDVLVHRAPNAITTPLRYILAGTDVPLRLSVSSCVAGEGVTSTSRTLAALMAHDWRAMTCWIDVNWWKPEAPAADAGLFASTLADAVNGSVDVSDLPTATSIRNLSMVAAGEIGRSSRSQLPRNERLWRVIDELAASFDHIVLDLPPVLETADALALGRLSDAYLLVVRQQAVSSNQVRTALRTMNTVPCLGTTLNAAHSNVPRWLRSSDDTSAFDSRA